MDRALSARLGWTWYRQHLLVGLREVLDELRMAGCSRAWLDGSFVTRKENPGDFDMCWDMAGVDLRRLRAAAPVVWDLDAPRVRQKARYGGDILPNVIEASSGMPFVDFFQQNPVTGASRGIVLLHLEVDLD